MYLAELKNITKAYIEKGNFFRLLMRSTSPSKEGNLLLLLDHQAQENQLSFESQPD